MTTRRDFIKKATTATAALTFGGALPAFSAKSYANIIGANDKIRMGAIGVNSRGTALTTNFSKQPQCEITYVCDVDSQAITKCINEVNKAVGYTPKGEKDIRKMLEKKDVDAVLIATPDHWHAPAALLAMKANKDVYLEKPCSYCPEEGEILVKAAKKYNKVLQMGNQRRSWPNVREGIMELKNGIIGNVHYGKSWYTNNRPSIGIGKNVAVPDWLDWELWQGPAPRVAFKDNYIHYNWHWFWHWGTGEALNNGTHMMDLLRWGLDLEYPVKVDSSGGRYYYKDDWETPDTQNINIEFPGGKYISWEGRSCNGRHIQGHSTGCEFYGDKGTLLITGGDSYIIYDDKNRIIKEQKSRIEIDPRNLMNPAEQLDSFHIQNFFNAIQKDEKLYSDIDSGHKSTLLVQLGNIALRTGHALNINPQNGHILKDADAERLWSRAYEPGWEMIL